MDDPVSRLMQMHQKLRITPLPRFENSGQQGPPHMPEFKMAVFTKGQRFEGLNWRPSKQAAKAEAALAAIVGLGWAPKDAISNAPQQPLQPNVTALVQELVASNGIPHQPSLNPAAISLLFELARTQRVSVTDVYETTSLGFHTCAFMWGTRRLAESDPFQRKKDAKCHAAERALAEINGELGKPETRTEQGAAQPIQDDTMQIDPSPRQPEIVPVTAAADPVVTLATLYKVQYPQDPAPPLYTEISNPAGFQYAVALNGRVVATSDVFSNKFCAKRNAAVTVLGVLSEWAQDPRKRKRLENGGESASGLNTTMDASFLSSVDGPDQWDKQLATFADLIGGSMDLKKCTNNIIMTLCLALQSYADLSVDRIVIGGPFGRGTALLCDYTIDLTLLRTRPFTAPTDAGGVSSLRDPRLHDLVAAALARSPLSACIVQTAHDARDGCVEVVYRGIQSLNVRVWEGINLVPREGVQGNLKPSQTGREGQEGNGSVGIAQLQRFQQTLQNSTAIYHVRNQSVGMKLNVEDLMAWSPTFSESNTLFFRNRSACAPLCRILRFWTLPLAFSHEHARTLGNALDLIAAYAWDSVERSVAGYDPTRVSLSFALEGALRILENAERMRVFWNEFYLRSEMQAARLAAGAPPLLLDPANPFHNIFETVSYTVWDRLAIHAREARLRLFEEILSPGVDFISAALNPVLATSTEVSYLDISVSILVSKDQFHHTTPDFQHFLPPAAEPPFEDGEIPSADPASLRRLQDASRFLQACLLFQTHAMRPLADAIPSHAEVARIVDAAVQIMRACVRDKSRGGNLGSPVDEVLGYGMRPIDACLGTILWPAFSKFAVSIQIVLKA